MQNMIPFSFESREIRVITVNDETWLVAKDVLYALDYSESSLANIQDRISHVPDEWKGRYPIVTLGGTQELWCISEQGLYFFLNRSDKPKALPMQKWVAGEVLPSIRKTGNYAVGKDDPRNIEIAFTSCLNIAKLCGLVGNMAVLSADTGTVALTGKSALKLIGLTHLLADKNDKTYTVTELGQLISPKVSARKFNLMLEAAGLQKRELDQWVPCEKAKGLYEWLDTNKKYINGSPVKQLKWFKRVIDLIS